MCNFEVWILIYKILKVIQVITVTWIMIKRAKTTRS